MVKERANGLYGVTSFLIANILIGIPFLCILLTSVANQSSFHFCSLL